MNDETTTKLQITDFAQKETWRGRIGRERKIQGGEKITGRDSEREKKESEEGKKDIEKERVCLCVRER